MKLTFQAPHLSLVELPNVELPPFTLLTGVNGAGKTHLLQAIAERKVAVDVAPRKEQVRYFNWQTLVPNDLTTATISDSRRRSLTQTLNNTKAKFRETVVSQLFQLGLRPGDNDPWALALLPIETLLQRRIETAEPVSSDDGRILALKRTVTLAAQEARVALSKLNSLPLSSDTNIAEDVLLDASKLDTLPFAWKQSEPFRQAFSEMFFSYFQLRNANDFRRFAVSQGDPTDSRPLSTAEFEDLHGPPPWELVNRILNTAGLDFQISKPVGIMLDQFEPRLTKTSNGKAVKFSELSSGERVLMSFALSLYYAADARQLVARPKLLLLDEVDATLHPSMCRQLLQSIHSSFVEQSVSVLMTTHSPSTIAVAPEVSVYEMRPGLPGVHKVSREQAIASLTREIPTLSISFDGRRQVFVESALDAERFELLYRQMRASLKSERSLTFIPVGKGEHGAGCAQVKEIVRSLANAGNASVLGLIDWDTTNSPSARVHVLGHGERYSIENFLLDPLLVAAAAIRDTRSLTAILGLPTDATAASLAGLDQPALQQVSHCVQRLVLSRASNDDLGILTPVSYVSGISIETAQAYLRTPGHDLQALVVAAFPTFKKFKNNGALLRYVVDPILVELPGFLPTSIRNTLQRLLDMSLDGDKQ